MSSAWNLDKITDAFSSASQGVGSWQHSLDVITAEVGGAGATVVPVTGRFGELPSSRSFEEALARYRSDGWINRDVRFQAAGALARKGIATDLDFINDDAIRRHPYYQEWLRPFGLKWFAAVPIKTTHESWVLSIQRSEAQGPFSEHECNTLRMLSQNFSTSAAVGNAMNFARADAAEAAFDMGGKGLVLLDRHGDVVRWNKSAEVSFSDHLFVRNKRLTTSDSATLRAMNKAIHDAVASKTSAPPIAVARLDALPIVLYISPATRVAVDLFSPCQIFVVIVDLKERRIPAPQILQHLFGLTKAESELACNLARGRTLQEVAGSQGISYETERSRLRSIFEKTGVNSQVDLVSMVLLIEFGNRYP
ncbi:helix-turn-helix transcriptional regulator [Rhizobium laguerreae]|uniref:LuxR C-terminal-related transcriptional regulator n=1 Tax=Rhizobium laguerreae TaxID=1076926 RepID=UPI001C90A857|nr:LuxR C-terminal-related transcriptional regulator [Rhizobium laguerreae]MBY3282873.1 helix-turn-helix transcriptional regulator [Rhizobium laguerreae]MBY3289227.1 helix-turn-helix transcriptional regulator [Rhizobium laguerreae]